LVLDALELGKISVGPPYFNTIFAPLIALLGLLLGFGILARWKQQALGDLLRRLGPVFAFCLVMAITVPFLVGQGKLIQVATGLLVAFWVISTNLIAIRDRLVHKRTLDGFVRALPRGFVGMSLAHIGFAAAIIGITLTTLYGVERDVKLTVGESVEAGGYRFQLDGLDDLDGPNYRAIEARISVHRGDAQVAELRPQKRIYRVQTMPMTEAGIDAGLVRDLYVALGESLGGEAWSVRLQVKPGVRWIWIGGLMMALGGLLAATDRRYRLVVRRSEIAAKLDAATAPAS
jgi:cytochrome c-type biogenesis protein CcmF